MTLKFQKSEIFKKDEQEGRPEKILAEQFGLDGKVDRIFRTTGWFRPAKVELVAEDVLQYTFSPQPMRVCPPRDLVISFLELRNAPAQRILRFAQQYGPLYQSPPSGAPSSFDHVLEQGEPIKAWRALAQRAFNLLEAELDIRRGPKRDSDARRRTIATAINRLFGTGRARLTWHEGHFDVALTTTCLVDAVGLQLIALLTNSRGFAYCPSCAEFFPVAGKQLHCTKCGPKQANKLAQRDRYGRMKRARQLAGEGKPAKEIAHELKRSIEQVERWIE